MNNGIRWYQNLQEDLECKVEDAKIAFAVELSRQLELFKALRSDLATNMGTSAAYITKVMRGESNLTIESMVKLSDAANGELHIHIAPKNASVRWFDIHVSQPQKGDAWAKAKVANLEINPICTDLSQEGCDEYCSSAA